MMGDRVVLTRRMRATKVVEMTEKRYKALMYGEFPPPRPPAPGVKRTRKTPRDQLDLALPDQLDLLKNKKGKT